MSKPRLFITPLLEHFNILKGENLETLKQWFNVYYADEKEISRDDFLIYVKGATAIMAHTDDVFDESVAIAAGPTLKVICISAAGYNNVDTQVMKKYGIRIGLCGSAVTHSTAEFAVALLLAISRKLIDIVAFYKRNPDPQHLVSAESSLTVRGGLKDSTVAIIGAGRIGQSIARKVAPFDIKRLLYYSNTEKATMKALGGELHRSLEYIVRESDYIILSLPHTPQTDKIINKKLIDLMKPTAILVNIGRGGLIDQDALVKALENRQIAGAALDVTTPEPLPLNHPLFKLDNVLLTPHIAVFSTQTHNDMAKLMVKNAVTALKDEPMEDELVL